MVSNSHDFGLDRDKGIAQFGGNEAIYHRILGFYVSDMQSLLAAIETVNADDLVEYAKTLHGIKGSSRGVSADKLGDAAENLERAAKDDDFDYVSTHHTAFIADAQALLQGIEAMLSEKSE